MENAKRGCPRKNHFISIHDAPIRINPDYTAYISNQKAEWRVDLNQSDSRSAQLISNTFFKVKEKSLQSESICPKDIKCVVLITKAITF